MVGGKTNDLSCGISSLVELIPCTSTTTVCQKHVGNKPTSKTQSAPQVETVTTVDDEENILSGTFIKEGGDLFSVLSRV